MTNDAATLSSVRSLISPTLAEVLSLEDLAELEPSLDGRNVREDAVVAATIISSRAALPTIAVSRSFTIDPLFASSPNLQLSRSRDYPTWTWQIPAAEQMRETVTAVNDAENVLQRHGYCGPDDRGAYFLTTICFMAPGGKPHFIDEWCDGQFYLFEDAETERGIEFSRCLVPTGYSQPLAQLDSATRAELSDMRKAIQSFVQWWKREQ